MVDINRGYTFSDDGTAGGMTVTASNLTSLVSNATLSNIVRGEFDSNSRVPYYSSTPPASPESDDLWLDTTNNVLRQRDGTSNRWHPIGKGFSATNGLGNPINKGQIVRISAGYTVVPMTTSGDRTAVGVAAHDIPGSTLGLILTSGWYSVLATARSGGWTAGDPFMASGEFTGYAEKLIDNGQHGRSLGVVAVTVTQDGLVTGIGFK